MWAVRLKAPALSGQRAGDWFHFCDRLTYDEPQFGDEYHAKKYVSKAGALNRVRSLSQLGYLVDVEAAPCRSCNRCDGRLPAG